MTAFDNLDPVETEDSAFQADSAAVPLSPARAGIGFAGRHHGEILQGVWHPPEETEGVRPADSGGGQPVPGAVGPVPCLVTMPVPEIGSKARFVRRSDPSVEIRPAWRVKAARAARLTLDFLGEKAAGGVLAVDCSVPAGLGLGSSTSDVVATIRAVCDAHGVAIDSQQVARLAVAAEGAIDPIMFDEVVLFAQRQGRVLEHWDGGFPEYLVVSVDTDPRGGGVDTLSRPVPGCTATELAQYDELIRRARAALYARDAAAMAAVATRSAELNQRFLPMRGFEDLLALARRPGCLGLQISHSGTVAGLLFEPAADRRGVDGLKPRLLDLGMRCLGVFRTGTSPR